MLRPKSSLAIHLLKSMINPIITKFGWIVVSKYSNLTEKFIGLSIKTYPDNCEGRWVVWVKLRK